MLVPDGVYLTETDPPYFRKVPAPTAAELQTLVQTIGERIGQRRLERTGKLVRDEESSYLTLDSQKNKLERVARYITRPPVAIERFSLTSQGQVKYSLKTPYRDGTTHVIFEPLDFIAR
jgi:hypothetical protein